MVKSRKEQHGLGIVVERDHWMAPSSSSAGGLSSAQLMLLRAAIDGDLRLLKDMVVCLDKGKGGAATVGAVTYRGVGALHMAARMGRKPVLEYLVGELGMDAIGATQLLLSKGTYIDGIICEVKSLFPQAQGHAVGVLLQEQNRMGTSNPILSWEDLPSDVVYHIACSFSSAEIYSTVRSVCKQWATAMAGSLPLDLHSTQIPFLLLPPLDIAQPYSFWRLRNRNSPACDVLPLPNLSYTAGHVVVGSSFGWLLVLDPCSLSLFILNPITGESIPLPSLLGICCESVDPVILVRHAVLSSDPSCSNCWHILLFLTTDHTRCFSYRYGDSVWTQHVHDECLVEDVVFFVDRFVALDREGTMGLFDICSDDPEILFVPFIRDLSQGSYNLVVGSSQEELLLVTSTDLDMPQVTPGHRPLIERLFISSRGVWRSISDTAGAIYLGYGNSVMVDGSRLPPSVEGGVHSTQTYSRVMGSRGLMHCGGVIRTSTETLPAIHDMLHVQLFSDDSVWLTRKPWWVTPNIFQSCRRSEHEAVVDSNLS